LARTATSADILELVFLPLEPPRLHHESDFFGLRRLNKEHTTSGSKWTEKDAAKPSLFVLALELHFIA
jgi:hypothetical protein